MKNESGGLHLHHGRERFIDVALSACPQDMDLEPEDAGRRLHVSRYSLRERRVGRVDEQGHDGGLWDDLVQQLQPLRPDRHGELGDAGHIAAWLTQAGYKSKGNRIATDREDDRNPCGRGLCRQGRRGAAERGDHGHLTTNQIGRKRRQSIILTACPAVLDGYVATLVIAGLVQALAEGAQTIRVELR